MVRNKKTYRVWDLPDSLFILFEKKFNIRFFNHLAKVFGTHQKYAEFLGITRQYLRQYRVQKATSHGILHPVCFPLSHFKKSVPFLDKTVLNQVEPNIKEIRSCGGLSITKPQLPFVESPELYRITAHIIADGSAGAGKTPYYANTCNELREQFKKDLKSMGKMKIYDRKPRQVDLVYFPKTVTDILAHIFDIKFTYPNRIPYALFDSTEQNKAAFLQAIFDDEGSMTAQLAIGINNKLIMEELKKLIVSLGVETGKICHHVDDLDNEKITLSIRRKSYKTFYDKIGFAHPKKQARLKRSFDIKNRKQRTRDPEVIKKLIVNNLKDGPLPTIDLANKLLFTRNGLAPHLDRMEEEGAVIKQGYRNKILWALT